MSCQSHTDSGSYLCRAHVAEFAGSAAVFPVIFVNEEPGGPEAILQSVSKTYCVHVAKLGRSLDL